LVLKRGGCAHRLAHRLAGPPRLAPPGAPLCAPPGLRPAGCRQPKTAVDTVCGCLWMRAGTSLPSLSPSALPLKSGTPHCAPPWLPTTTQPPCTRSDDANRTAVHWAAEVKLLPSLEVLLQACKEETERQLEAYRRIGEPVLAPVSGLRDMGNVARPGYKGGRDGDRHSYAVVQEGGS